MLQEQPVTALTAAMTLIVKCVTLFYTFEKILRNLKILTINRKRIHNLTQKNVPTRNEIKQQQQQQQPQTVAPKNKKTNNIK